MDENDDKIETQGKPIKSNIIDNESAKMSTGHGVIQGYNRIAAVDDRHQVVVWAEASTTLNPRLSFKVFNCPSTEVRKYRIF